MVGIYKTQNMTWLWKKCVTVIIFIMSYLTVNMCYFVVINDQVLSYPDKRQIEIHQKNYQKHALFSTEIYHGVQLMTDVQTRNKICSM